MTKKHKVQHPQLNDLIKAGIVMDGTLMMAYHHYQDLFGRRNSTEHLSEKERDNLDKLVTEIGIAIEKQREFQTVLTAYLASNEYKGAQH